MGRGEYAVKVGIVAVGPNKLLGQNIVSHWRLVFVMTSNQRKIVRDSAGPN